MRGKFPLLVPVRPIPLPGLIMELILKTHRNAIVVKRPQFLDKPVVQLTRPFALQKFDDPVTTAEEFGTVPPSAVRRIGKRDTHRVTVIPGIFRHADFLDGTVEIEGG